LPQVVRQAHQCQIVRVDKLVAFKGSLHPPNQSSLIVASKEDQRKTTNPLGLHQREDFKKLVQRAKTTRQKHESSAVFHKTDLAREKVVEMNRDIRVTIGLLLEWQLNVQPY